MEELQEKHDSQLESIKEDMEQVIESNSKMSAKIEELQVEI